MLQWQAFPGIFASKYKILFGLQPGQYTDYAFTQGSQTAALVNDLIDGVPYYFAVTALNSVGQEVSALSPEAMAVPSGSGFHASASSVPFGFGGAQASVLGNDQLAKVPAVAEAGFESLWLVLCSLLFAGLVYAYRRQARLSL